MRLNRGLCVSDVVKRDLSFISSILSSPEGSGPLVYGPRRVNGSSKFRARGYAKALRDPVQVGESFRALYRRVSPYFVKKRSWVFMHFLTYGGFCCHPRRLGMLILARSRAISDEKFG